MSEPTRGSAFQDKAFLVLLVAVSLAFGWILLPFYGAILWAVILALVFAPVQRWLGAILPGRRNLAALLTLLIIVGIVLIPLAFTGASIVSEATSLYDRLQSGELNLGRFLQRFLDALPGWASNMLAQLGVSDVNDAVAAAKAAFVTFSAMYSAPKRWACCFMFSTSSGPMMPCGQPGKFSTSVVRESWPPASKPEMTSGFRLARAV